MRVRFHLGFGIVLVLAALFILFTGLALGGLHLLFLGALNLALGVGISLQPMFVVHDDRIEMRNLLGMTMKTHTYDSLASLEIRGRKVFRKGESKALASALVGRGSDWEVVCGAIEAAGE
jgi:hypothetical protein